MRRRKTPIAAPAAQPANSHEILTPKQAAAYLGIHPATLRKMHLVKIARGPSGYGTGYWRSTIEAAATRVKM